MNAQERFKLLVNFNFTVVCEEGVLFGIFKTLAFFLEFSAFDMPKIVETLIRYLRAVLTLIVLPLKLLQSHLVLLQVASLVVPSQIRLFNLLALNNKPLFEVGLLRSCDAFIV